VRLRVRRKVRPRRTPVQHVAHHTHRLLRWFGAIAAVLVLVTVGAIWRLLQGPVELDRLVPYVQEALQRSSAGIAVAVAGVSVGIDSETHQVNLRAQDVRLSLPDGEKLANFPQMAASFSLGGLLGGRIEPTRLVVDKPVIVLTRDENGAVSFRVGNSEMTPDQLALDNALAVLAPLRPDAPWDKLREIAVRDATIVLNDHATGRVWHADRVAANLARDDDGSAGDISFTVALGDSPTQLRAKYRYVAATRKLDVQMAADGIEPAALAAVSPVLAPLARAGFPISGSAGVRIDIATGRPEAARLDLGFGAGRIDTDLLAAGHLPVASGELHADYAPDIGELRLDRLALDLNGGTSLVLSGKLHGLQPQLVAAGATLPAALAGTLGVKLSHVPAARLGALWPHGVSPGGRRWITANLPEGILDELSVQLGIKLDPANLAVQFYDPRGSMRYRDLTVEYLDGLPPVKKVSGTATLGDRHLEFAVAGGALKGLKVTGGTVAISNIGAPVETLGVDLGVSGPLQDVLETIDAKPLHYAHEAGIDPARLGGKADAQLHFKLPLLADLKFDAVEYAAKAMLTGVSYAKIALGRGLTDGNFALDLGRAGVHAHGKGKFDAVPATIDGNLYFHPKSGPRAQYRIGLTLDDAARRRLDWDDPDHLVGPVGIDMTYSVPSSGTSSRLDAALDLGGAQLASPEAGWKKPPHQPASAKVVAELNDEVVTRIPQLDIKAPGLDGRLAIALDPRDRGIERVDIRHLTLVDNDFAGTISRRPEGGWRADIRGARLDVHRVLKRAIEDDTAGNPMPLAIDAHVARLILGPHREAQNVSASLLRERGAWQSVKIDGRYPNGRRLALALGGQRLHLESDDLGASLALFGIADNVVGGNLAIDGTLRDENGHRVLRAHLDGADYSLVRAPALARLLSLTSLDGIAGLMSGSGIPFTTLRGDIVFTRGQIAIERLLAYGGALGVTAQGWLSPGQDRIAVDGTLAPAYALNSVIGNFPVLGSILMGGEGQGLFAAAFRLTGSNDDPSVSVNPLSALTPGLLRHLFDPFVGAPQAQPVSDVRH
jgi:uncharacterized protein DUF3971/AsmA-like protein